MLQLIYLVGLAGERKKSHCTKHVCSGEGERGPGAVVGLCLKARVLSSPRKLSEYRS